MHEEDEIDNIEITEKVIPYVRIYLSVGRENHDLLSIEEMMGLLSQESASPNEKIKEFMDAGMVNIYVCSYDKVAKVI
jgi:hypothetical protein